VWGPGGAGKTRLLLEAVRRDLWKPACWVCLEGVVDGEGLRVRLGDALPGLATDGPSGFVVLDAVDACTEVLASWLPDWLRRAPKVRVVLTSRQRPDISGAVPIWLPPLAVEDGVRLYEGRAAAAGALHPPGDPAVGGLVEALDGLPLAIELAAARAGLRTIDELRVALAAPLDVLCEGTTGGRSLRAVLAWSFQLLAPEDRYVLERCAVLEGTFGREHAEAVAGRDAVEALGRLRERSLVRATSGARRSFSLALGVRALALEQAAESVLHAAEDALVRWASVRAGDSALLPNMWVRGELDRLRGLHDRIRDRAPEQARTLVVIMAANLAERGDAAEVLERLGEAPPCSLAGVVRARMLLYEGRHAEARRLLEEAVGASEARVRGWASVDLGELLLVMGEPERAARSLQQGRAELESVSDAVGVAFSLQREATALRFSGRTEEALQMAREARRQWQALHDPVGLAAAWTDEGLLLRQVGRLPEARRLLRRALPVFEQHGAIRRAARLHGNLGVLCTEQGDRELARRYYRAALDLQHRTGNQRGAATVRINLGLLAGYDGEFDVAEEHLLAARDTTDDFDLPLLGAVANGVHGLVRFHEGRLLEAISALEQAAGDLHGRGYLDQAAWFVTHAGVARVLEGLPTSMGAVEAVSPAFSDVASRLAAGDASGALEALDILPEALLQRDEGRALACWLRAQARNSLG
jgi:tetratricopeptide (TPR) repeat protein